MKTETLLTVILAGVVLYMFTQRKQETTEDAISARALTRQGRGGSRFWGQADGRVFDWIDYRMSPESNIWINGGGGGKTREKEML